MGDMARTLIVCGLVSGTQPITLMGLLLVMTGRSARRNGWAFLVGGFVVETLVLVLASLVVGGSIEPSSGAGRSFIVVKLLFGVAAIVIGVRLRRPPKKPSPDVPPSLERLRGIGPRQSFIAGLVLADYQGPFLASLALASAGVSVSGQLASILFFTVFASGVPLAILLIATRSDATHQRFTDRTTWVLRNRRRIASVLLLAIGALIVIDAVIAWLLLA